VIGIRPIVSADDRERFVKVGWIANSAVSIYERKTASFEFELDKLVSSSEPASRVDEALEAGERGQSKSVLLERAERHGSL